MGERCDVDLLPMLEEREAEYDSMVLARPDKKPKEIVVKEKQTERLNKYAIYERLRTGMNMNKIHLAHFSHR